VTDRKQLKLSIWTIIKL